MYLGGLSTGVLYDLVAKYTRTNRSVQLLTNFKHATLDVVGW